MRTLALLVVAVLVGSLGRAALGESIDSGGYAPVFYTTAAVGVVAVVLTSLEWVRQARAARRAQSGISSFNRSTSPAR